MAIKEYYVGSVGPLYHDDGSFPCAFSSDAPIAPGVGSDPTHAALLGDIPALTGLDTVWPIGAVFLSVVSTNPATLLGFGTWSQIAQGQFLVGFKTGDSDFGTVEGVGGAKTHTHTVDVVSTTSSAPSAVHSAQSGTGFSTVDSSHTHDVDPASVISGNNSSLQPFFVIYAWKRTA
jgi:hypothetical protein